jgi:RNase P/RNase MRP subunit p30
MSDPKELNVELDDYERWIESKIEKGNFVPVENFEEWKKALEESAHRTLEKLGRKRVRFTLEVQSSELKEEAIRLLKERFGEKLKVVEG